MNFEIHLFGRPREYNCLAVLWRQPDVIWEDVVQPHSDTGRDDHLGGEAGTAGDGNPAVDEQVRV